MSNSDLSLAAPIGEENPLQIKPFGVHAQAGPNKLCLRPDAATIH